MNYELPYCAKTGNLERVKQLVEGGTDIDETNSVGSTALLLASRRGLFEIVVFLVEYGANVTHTDRDGMTALHWACIDGNLSLIKYLLEHGARITARADEGLTALLCRRLQNAALLTCTRSASNIPEYVLATQSSSIFRMHNHFLNGHNYLPSSSEAKHVEISLY
jgi:ankyrin repeat protein